jgi:hypothetical protein
MKDNFTYTCRLKMDGHFPGAPDYTEYTISEDDYDRMMMALKICGIKMLQGGV